ncbi:MAG TPA: response regulator [Pirellulales bacterium]|nr:response regulator [Pirellulales bacterium]
MQPTMSPLRVLVVDDSDDAAIAMASLLKHGGHDAVVVRGGEAALEQAPLFHPDVMFIDLSMPGIDGFNVAQRLRQNPEFATTPLVAVSGHIDVENRVRATAAGFTEFLAKPYPFVVLSAVMERVTARVSASRRMAATARRVVSQTRQRIEQPRQGLDAYCQRRLGKLLVSVEKSGISNVISLSERSSADELRRWLKEQRCRVGPVFEQDPGRFSFYCYSKRHRIGELIAKRGTFIVEMIEH